MTPDIALLLAQDGITNGAIYALLALALVLAFAVTRVIFIPQGEFVAYGALTLVAVQAGRMPGTVWLLLAAGALVALVEAVAAARTARWGQYRWVALWNVAYPLALGASCTRFRARRLADAAADPDGACHRCRRSDRWCTDWRISRWPRLRC